PGSDGEQIIREAGSEFFKVTVEAVENHGTDYAAVTQHIKTSTGTKGRSLFQPLRIGLTGEKQGPELAGLLALIGTTRAIQRLNLAKSVAET
ncbi:MAG: glutamate--tRNA ligase, partial [Gammaproteobacteria bacterium]|nr:glutamate--tRNA ligase [Gammaproteobacteria bacterium]